MKKKIIALLLIATLSSTLFVGCGNQDLLDTNYTYDRAIMQLANGEIVDIEIKSWRDYDDGEQIQVIAKDGTVYLTSSFRCDLIKE